MTTVESTDSREARIGRIEGQLDQVIERLNNMERRIDRYFLTLLTIMLGGFIALATLIIRIS